MTVSAEFAPVLARMAVSTLRECIPHLPSDLRAELLEMLQGPTNSRRAVAQVGRQSVPGVASPASLASADDPAPH